MALFWLGFFALVAVLLVFDLGVLHRRQQEPTLRRAIVETAGWAMLGLAFTGVVYLIYENNWLGAHMTGCPPGHADGTNAAITYVSAYLLEQALSVDNLFVIALVFKSFRIPPHYQHRVLFWGILGAIGFRVTMLGGGVYLVARFDWIFYIFGAYLAYKGWGLARGGDDENVKDPARSRTVRALRQIVPIREGDYGGAFSVVVDGRRWLTLLAVCLVSVELNDIVFALDSIPAVMSVSLETFVIVTSNIFAILGLRSMYFVLARLMAKFEFLEHALGVLLIGIGAKMVFHVYTSEWPHWWSLVAIAGILAAGIVASVIANRGEPPPDPSSSLG